MTSFVLKIIAIVSMLIDHIGAIFFPQYIIFRIVGRIAFPIFCFLLVEGFFKTHNRLKHCIRLVLFAVVSQLPYCLAFGYDIFSAFNVMVTLLIGYCLMWISEQFFKGKSIVSLSLFLLGAFIATAIKSDYGWYGIFLIYIFYVANTQSKEDTQKKFALFSMLNIGNVIVNSSGVIQAFSLFSVLPIYFYNGQRGRKMKYFFYVFYPTHLLLLYIIKII